MFKKVELIIKNRQLQKENMELYEENKLNREDIADLELKCVHAKSLVQNVIAKLIQLEEIDRSDIDEKSKIKYRNVIFNELRIQSINIKNELISDYHSQN